MQAVIKYNEEREDKASVNFKDSWKPRIFLTKPHTQYKAPLIPKLRCVFPWHTSDNP